MVNPQALRNKQDIRSQIAQTPQMDPNNFPRPDYQRYPLMPSDGKGKPYYDESHRAIILHNAAAEDEFAASHPDYKRHADPQDTANELQSLRQQLADANARLESVGPAPQQPDKVASDDPNVNKPVGGGLSGVMNAKVPSDNLKPKPAAPKPGSKLDD